MTTRRVELDSIISISVTDIEYPVGSGGVRHRRSAPVRIGVGPGAELGADRNEQRSSLSAPTKPVCSGA
jgi:hypothetical protein